MQTSSLKGTKDFYPIKYEILVSIDEIGEALFPLTSVTPLMQKPIIVLGCHLKIILAEFLSLSYILERRIFHGLWFLNYFIGIGIPWRREVSHSHCCCTEKEEIWVLFFVFFFFFSSFEKWMSRYINKSNIVITTKLALDISAVVTE